MIALVAVTAAHRHLRAALLLARRASRSRSRRWAQAAPQDFLTTALSELDGTSGLAELRAALHACPRGGPERHRPPLARAPGRRPDPDRPRERVRARPALDPRAKLAAPAARARRLHPRAAQHASRRWTAAFGKALAAARFHNGALVGRVPGGPLRPRADPDGRPARDGPQRRARRRADLDQPLLPDELHQGAALPRRRQLPRKPRPARSTCSAASGG